MLDESAVAALSLSPAERQAILLYWPDQDSFLAWQREALASEIERRAAAAGQAAANETVKEAILQAHQSFPTVFAGTAQ